MTAFLDVPILRGNIRNFTPIVKGKGKRRFEEKGLNLGKNCLYYALQLVVFR